MNREEARVVVHETLVKLSHHYGIPTPNPAIDWSLKGTSCLGQAIGISVLRFHAEALEKLGDEYKSTLVHEACHTITEARRALALAPRKGRWSGHGYEWSQAMRLAGYRPDRCGTVPDGVTLTPARKVQRFTVRCSCRTHEITKQRLAKLSTYRCRACGSGLELAA